MHISRKEFDALVEAAIDGLPEEFAVWLEEVPVVVEDVPSPADASELEENGASLGMYIGPSMVDTEASGAPPAQIMLYREPLMDACRDRVHLAEEIRKTLIHELGHHAGMDEEDLERHGYGAMEDDDIEWDTDDA